MRRSVVKGMSTAKRVVSATITHDLETWRAVVGKQLSGHDDRGRPLSSSATVLAIDPEQKIVYTDGKGGQWHTEARVHGLSDIKFAETEDAN